MATKKNEQTSDIIGTIAAKVLRTGRATPKEAVALAASALTQRPDARHERAGLGGNRDEPAIRRNIRTR